MRSAPKPPTSPFYSKPPRDERDYEDIYYHFDDYAQVRLRKIARRSSRRMKSCELTPPLVLPQDIILAK